MQHLITHLDLDMKVIVDFHVDQNSIDMLRKDYKIELVQFCIQGNFSKGRGILMLTKISSRFVAYDFKMLDQTNVVQIDENHMIGLFTILAIYAPDGDNANYFKTIDGKVKNTESDYQIFIGDFNVTLDHSLIKLSIKLTSTSKVGKSSTLGSLIRSTLMYTGIYIQILKVTLTAGITTKNKCLG